MSHTPGAAFPIRSPWGTLRRMTASTPPGDAAPMIDGEDAAVVVARLQHGDGQALFGFVRRLGLTDAQADDAVQEVFARMLEVQRQGIAIANPRSWAFQAVYRIAMDQHRLRARISGIVDRLSDRNGGAPPRDATDRIVVWAAVDRLSLRQRQVLYLRYRADLAYEEIGSVLGISPSAARSHATQAIATLRERLSAEIEELPT